MTIEKEQSVETTVTLKKTYSSPRLSNYGSISELTLAGVFGGNDGNSKCTGNSGGNPECEVPPS